MQWATTRSGTDLTWAVEDNRSVTGLLERELLAAGPWRVVRCPPHLMARSRESARERGKSDPIDALAVAQATHCVNRRGAVAVAEGFEPSDGG
jgi:transposase